MLLEDGELRLERRRRCGEDLAVVRRARRRHALREQLTEQLEAGFGVEMLPRLLASEEQLACARDVRSVLGRGVGKTPRVCHYDGHLGHLAFTALGARMAGEAGKGGGGWAGRGTCRQRFGRLDDRQIRELHQRRTRPLALSELGVGVPTELHDRWLLRAGLLARRRRGLHGRGRLHRERTGGRVFPHRVCCW